MFRRRHPPTQSPVIGPAIPDWVGTLKGSVNEFNQLRTTFTYYGPPDMKGALLSEAGLDGANLTLADLTLADLKGASLTRADLTATNLAGADLRQANLTETNLNGADLRRANLDGAELTRADLTGANLDGTNLTGAEWDPEHPPTWPDGFDSAETAPSDPDPDYPLSAHRLHPTRVKRIAPDEVPDLVRRLEPFIAETSNLLDTDTFTDEDAAHVEHALRGLHQELWQNPGEPSPLVVSAYSATLFETVAPYLPLWTSDPRGFSDQATHDHARRVVEHAANFGAEEPESASTEAANSADELTAMTVAATHVTDASLDESAQRDAARSVYESLGWFDPTATKATVGALGGVTLLPQVIQGFSPIWSAIIGAVVGVLGHLFRTRRGPEAS